MRKQALREGKEPGPATQHGSCITRAAVAGSWKIAFLKEEFVMPRTGKEGVCGFDADMTLGRVVNTGVPPVAGHLLRMGICALCYGMSSLSPHAL